MYCSNFHSNRLAEVYENEMPSAFAGGVRVTPAPPLKPTNASENTAGVCLCEVGNRRWLAFDSHVNRTRIARTGQVAGLLGLELGRWKSAAMNFS